jgi:RimJ/RimL family protein N-acetyltransferase
MTSADTDGADRSANPEPASYPRQVQLRDGSALTLRLMTPDDAALLHGFFCRIPAADLLFLRRNVTDRRVIDQWAERVQRGSVVTVFGLRDGRLVGEASLHLSSPPWSEHVGEVRVVVDQDTRLGGLGTLLTGEIFLIAVGRGIRKIVAEMTIEQKPAIAVFQKLGFSVEGLLRNHVRDQAGATHDLVLMGHDTQEFYEQMRAYGIAEEFGDGGG